MFHVVSAQKTTYFPILCQMGRAFVQTDGYKCNQSFCTQKKVTENCCDNQIQGQIMTQSSYHCRFLCFHRKFSTSNKNFTVKVNHKKNYYQVLGVTPKCTDARVKQAYYRLSKVYHPDVNKSKEAVEKFHEITEAYEILSNSALRKSYDSGRHGHTRTVQRGVKPHPVNFNARGPHQYKATIQYNQAEWLKNHYSDAFKKSQEKKVEADFMREWSAPPRPRPQHDKELDNSVVPVTFLIITFTLVSWMLIKLYVSHKYGKER